MSLDKGSTLRDSIPAAMITVCPQSTSQEDYSAALLPSPPQDLASLMQTSGFAQLQDHTYNSRTFLASISGRDWAPRMYIVKHQGNVVGVVHAKERKLGAFKTGLIYADATLDNLVLSETVHREHVLRAAIGSIFASSGVYGLRISVLPGTDEFNAIQKVIETIPLEVSWARVENHVVLPLQKTYDDFLNYVGYRTRRNFRYYRRRFEAAGHSYVEQMSVADFDCAAHALMQKMVIGTDIDGVERGLKLMSAVRSPLLVGLRAQSGGWLAILGGWFERGQGTVFMQMNDDRDNAAASLSLVLRGYLIETLIRQQARELVFWAGVGGPLARYTYPLPSVVAYLDKPTFAWRSVRSVVARTRGLLPRDKSWMAEWILPSCPHELEKVG